MEALSLHELNQHVRTTLAQNLADAYWLQAELSDVRIHSTGHCYLEFVQKSTTSKALIAKARGTIWNHVFHLLRPYFERETGQLFAAGIKVQVKVHVDFHELYGYSLTVTDIDPTYTIGDMVRHRREILLQLQEEGVLTLNKELSLPQVPNRIAVISSAHAAGYDDFCNQLSSNPYGYAFKTHLFPATMQGDSIESSILKALDSIMSSVQSWDAVVIIRGGGSVSDLSGFDTYLLAAACAQFPLPIITGIGHERDDTLIDMIAHTRVKTPTAAAEFLINRLHEADLYLSTMVNHIQALANHPIEQGKSRISEITARIPHMLSLRQLNEKSHLTHLWFRLTTAASTRIASGLHQLELLEQRTAGCDPKKMLSRGFSLTLKKGHAITDASQLSPGDIVTICLAQGEAIATIKQITSPHNPQ